MKWASHSAKYGLALLICLISPRSNLALSGALRALNDTRNVWLLEVDRSKPGVLTICSNNQVTLSITPRRFFPIMLRQNGITNGMPNQPSEFWVVAMTRENVEDEGELLHVAFCL